MLAEDGHGEVLRAYRGKSIAKFSDGAKLPCQVRIQQLEDGKILVRCLFAPKHALGLLFRTDLKIESLVGRVQSGLTFRTEGDLFQRASNYKTTGWYTIVLNAQQIDIGSQTTAKSGSVCKFSLVNFEFFGNLPAKRIVKKGSQTVESHYKCLKLDLPWGNVVVHPVPSYEQVLNKIRIQKGIAVTSEAMVSVPPAGNFSEVSGKVDELCRLLSLARGTKINWISAESIESSGNPTYIILKNSVTWPFSSLVLIDDQNPDDTPLFIQTAYPAYLRCRNSYNLDVAIEQYLDAKRETACLETRGLAAVALVDSLQQLYASQNNLAEIVQGFSKQKKKVRKYVNTSLKSAFPDIKDEELHEMLQKISELNRRSFLDLLRTWTNALGLKMVDYELGAVKDTRNSLAHGLCFRSTNQREKVREYFRLINLINQIFLKLLGYSGQYVHVDLNTLTFECRELA